MSVYRLEELEAAVIGRNPLLAQLLRPALSEPDIYKMLKKAKVEGSIQPVLALYSWRNGTIFHETLRVSKTGFFPGKVYQFITLEMAIQNMNAHKECAFSRFPNLAGRYLPVFWNGATNWMALDLKATNASPIVLIRFYVREASLKAGHFEPEIHEKDPPRELYRSFEEFVADAIRANRENKPLACFQIK